MKLAYAPPLAFVLLSACGPDVANPTGNCEASSDGSRSGYHAADGYQWLPHCQNPLKREYWRVFARDERSAATIPRVDGEPLLAPACADPQHTLHALVAKYRLCSPAADGQTVAVVNAMLPEDALVITFFLHTQLRFKAVERKGGMDITPYAIPSDVLDACKLRRDMQSAALATACEEVRNNTKNGYDEGVKYDTAAPELADRLNDLYGIQRAD